MANTKKTPEQRKTKHLRIPLTQEQHAKILELHGETGMAHWAREVLLAAIDAELAQDRAIR